MTTQTRQIITDDDRQKIRDFLAGHRLTHGLGTETEPCSVAAVHLALYGRLSDQLSCASPVIQAWVIRIQDCMPVPMLNDEMEHGRRWREALPYLAWSVDPAREHERLGMILEWMWASLALPAVAAAVPASTRPAWERMLKDRSQEAAADAAADAAAREARAAMARAARWAEVALAYLNDGDEGDEADMARNAAAAVSQAAMATGREADGALWDQIDPAGLLARLVVDE